jgi:hypothetical protein
MVLIYFILMKIIGVFHGANSFDEDFENLNNAVKYALVGKKNVDKIRENPPLGEAWTSDEMADANKYSICPGVNTNLDFNMPVIHSITDQNGNDIYECLRGPYNFYEIGNAPEISGTISSESYYGSDQQIMYIKSCDLTLTPYYMNRYLDNSTDGTLLKQLSNTNTQNYTIDMDEYNATKNIEISDTKGEDFPNEK